MENGIKVYELITGIHIVRSIDVNVFHAHRHKDIEITYVFSGSGIHYVNGVAYPLNRGSLLCLSRKDIHMHRPESPMDICVVRFKSNYLNAALSDDGSADMLMSLPEFQQFADASLVPHVQLQGKDMYEIETLIARLNNEYLDGKPGAEAILRGGLLILIAAYFRRCSYQCETLSPIVRKVREYIDVNYNRHIDISEIARMYFYSPYYLSRIFKKSYGESVSQCIQRCRIMHAMNMLEETGMSVESICSEVGFKEKKQFYSLFKQLVGITPQKYRRFINQ